MDAADTADDLPRLLEYLKTSRGFDFTGYKHATLRRRILKRMQMVRIDSYDAYVDYLEVHPQEFSDLFNTILINVTAFFRDPSAWEYLAKEVLPAVLESKSPEAPIRVWSAGCASGEETYTLAILLAEALGNEQYRQRVKLYGTDVDEEALMTARHATYSEKAVHEVPPELLGKYFEKSNTERTNGHYVFRGDLRRCLIFGRHDLLQDAPISRVDLLVCRNTLMYFNAESQSKIVSRFQFALNDEGFLFLGRAEMLVNYASIFAPTDLRWRVFRKLPNAGPAEHLPAPMRSASAAEAPTPTGRVRELAFDTNPTPQFIINANNQLTLANEQARALFKLAPADIGRPIQDLTLSYRPVELRRHLDQLQAGGGPLVVHDVEWIEGAGPSRYYDLTFHSLREEAAATGVSVTLTDVTRMHQLQAELQRSSQELETAYEEVQSTNEELETTNEELQSTVEELETTNEELQSTNEELETMNEELQSTNDELRTTNEELQKRTLEAKRTGAYLTAILASIDLGIMVLDRQLVVQLWNRLAEDMWGLRAEEAQGHRLVDLDIGLPVAELIAPAQACMNGSVREDVELEAINRRGKTLNYHVACAPLTDKEDLTTGVILVMEERATPAV